jgi:3-oxoacyl-[acyl-carrier-protein] synthase-3
MNAMEIAGQMIERGAIEYALVVDGENSRFVQENTLQRLAGPDVGMDQFRKEFATLTLGSGGVAMVLGRHDELPDGHQFRGGVSIAGTEWSNLCRGQVDFMETDTRTLLSEGVKLAYRTYRLAEDVLAWTPGCLNQLILHQVSAVHTRKLCESLSLDPDKAMLTFPHFGNIGPASVPFTLAKTVEAGRIVKGDRVGLLGIGSGLNCSMAEIVW